MFYPHASRFPALLVLLTLSLLSVVAAFTARSSAAKLGLSSPTVALQQPNTVAPNSVRRLSLPAKDLVFDPNTQAIYASVPGTAGALGNSLTRIDPVAGTIGASVFIGSNPNKLAISDNQQFIYAGLDGEGAVRRFDIATQTAQLRFSLGNYEQNGALLVEDIEVLPGAPQSVAISRRVLRRSPDHAAVAIYDDGVQRPTITNVNVGTSNRIEFSSTAATIYGFNSQDTGLQTYRLSVTASGVSIAGQIPVSFQEFGNIEFEGGQLYHTAGKVSDPEAGTIIGTYAGMNFLPFNNAPSVVVDTPNNRVYFLAGGAVDPGSSGQARVYAFDKTTFALAASYTITSVTGRVGSLVQWGPNGLAFRDDNAVYLIPTPVPGPPPSLPTPTPVPTPTATPLPGELRQIALATKDLVVEPNAQNIYASVPGSAGALGNRLALIDPVSGAMASSVPIGSEPNKLAVSENGQFIYVGLDGDNAVRRFDVATQTAGPQFSTVAGPRDISAMPGNPNSIAVLRRASADEVLIYDNGVPRMITKLHDVLRIAFSNSPEVLYGVWTESSSYNFSKMTVASCGVALAKGTEGLFPTEDIKYDNGRAYSTRGFVIDPEIPSLVGTFFVSDIGFSFLVEPDSKANRLYSLTATGSSATLNVFDLQTFVLLGTLNLPGVTDFPTSLLRWGANGLVFNTPTQVFLLQNALIGGSLPVTPAPPALPATFTVTGNVMSNANLQPTSGVTITFSGSQSGTTQTDAQGNFSIPNVPLCGPLTVTPTKTNWIFQPASIVITDPSIQRANFASFHKVMGFVQSSVTVSEGTTKVFLAIGRTAGFPLPPTTTDIPYSTSSGTASDRSDFTPAFGTFHFDVGTSQAPLEVLITNDVFVEGSETFTATLEPVPGYDMVNQTVTVTIVDNDTTPPTTSPLQNALFFVRRHYHDFLNRDPDTAGLNFWTPQITVCNNETDPQRKGDCFEERHVNVSAAFFFSIEFQSTGYLVQRLYAVSFPDSVSRPRGLPRFNEFLRDTQQIGRGVIVGQGNWQEILEQNTQAFVRSWVDRSEFLAQNPASLTADQYVDGLFARGGVVPSAAERAAALTAYGSGGSDGRALALRSIAQSRSIYNRQYNPALVLMQYFGYLRRNPSDPPEPTLDFAGYDFWLNKLNEFSLPGEDVSNEAVALERVRRAQMVKSFLVSGEYMNRVGPDNFDIRQ